MRSRDEGPGGPTRGLEWLAGAADSPRRACGVLITQPTWRVQLESVSWLHGVGVPLQGASSVDHTHPEP